MVQANTILGWALLIGTLIAQLGITVITTKMGRMMPYYAFLTAMVFIPFMITAIAGVLNRERNLKIIKISMGIGLLFQVIFSLSLPLFFDKEFAYVGLLGVSLALVVWYFRRNVELQLLVVNSVGAVACMAILWLALTSIGII